MLRAFWHWLFGGAPKQAVKQCQLDNKLETAIRNNNFDKAKKALEEGANPFAECGMGYDVLYFTKIEKNENLFRPLQKYANQKPWPELLYAAQFGDINRLHPLLKQGGQTRIINRTLGKRH